MKTVKKLEVPTMCENDGTSYDEFLFDGILFCNGRFVLHKDYFSTDLGTKPYIHHPEGKKFVEIKDGKIEDEFAFKFEYLKTFCQNYDAVKLYNYYKKLKRVEVPKDFPVHNLYDLEFSMFIPEEENSVEDCIKVDYNNNKYVLNFPFILAHNYKWFLETGTSEGFSLYADNGCSPMLLIDETRKITIGAVMGLRWK